jgi:hypothetical protein
MASGGPVQILVRAHRSSAGEEHGEGLGVTKLGLWPDVRVRGCAGEHSWQCRMVASTATHPPARRLVGLANARPGKLWWGTKRG